MNLPIVYDGLLCVFWLSRITRFLPGVETSYERLYLPESLLSKCQRRTGAGRLARSGTIGDDQFILWQVFHFRFKLRDSDVDRAFYLHSAAHI